MVFKPFTTLARQSISRHLVNGYAQSVVAATQSSYASSTIPIKFGQNNAPAKIQNAFGGAHSGRAAPKDGSGSESVNAYFAAQSAADDKEDRKYLFSKKILWSKAQHQQQQKQLLGAMPEPIAEPLSVRTRSDSLGSVAEEEAIVELEAGASKEAEAAVVDEVEAAAEEVTTTEEPQASLEDVLLQEPETPETRELNAQLQSLRDQRRWEEVTMVFRHMTEQGYTPNTASYNLLLDSMVSLRPRYVAQVIDVYSAMLRQKLIPTTSTYTILIDFLSARALGSLKIATDAERDAQRFGVTLESKTQQVEDMKNEGAMDLALSLFYDSTEVRIERVFPTFVYQTLIHACSKYKRDDDMLKVYAHMETHGVAPTPEIIRSLIRGFGRTGDVRAAVETYNCWLQMGIAQDPAMMDQRYQVYTDLIKAYMDAGDAAGALTFLSKVVDISRERERIEWLKRAVVEGFVAQGDIAAAKKWTSQLAIQFTPSEWLARLMTRIADQDELDFSRQIYNTINFDNMELNNIQKQQTTAECQMSGLALCIRGENVDLARDLWRDLWDRNTSTGPDISATLAYVGLLFRQSYPNEALVVLNQFSNFFLEYPTMNQVPDPIFDIEAKRTALREGFEHVIVSLSARSLLSPSIALDIAGFSLVHCNGLGLEASRRVVGLFDRTRLMGLTASQLALVLQIQYNLMKTSLESGMPLWPNDSATFHTMFGLALGHQFPISGPIAELLGRGAAMLASVFPDMEETWKQYVQQEFFRTATPVSMVSVSPTLVAVNEHENPIDKHYDPYFAKIDVKTSDSIDVILDRSKYNKIADLRRMYRSSRRQGRTLRLTTLAKIITAAARTGMHEDFMDEIMRNAKIDCPPGSLEYPVARFGWGSLLDAMIAAQLNLGHRDKARTFHKEMSSYNLSPSANTYGLYIVSLKATHQTYDEASEAVTIFQEAVNENVLPTSFLYNAVIGKLAKARRVDDCLAFFTSMRLARIKPTSVTYGTMINALTRVGDETFAEELFQEMESMPNYKPRPAPYNSLIQFFITTKRDRTKVLNYYNRMLARGIAPTGHTYKLMIEANATLDEPDMAAAEGILDTIAASGLPIESGHHAALIHAKGCVLHDIPAAVEHFEKVINGGKIVPDSTLYQALLECYVANHLVSETPRWVKDMEHKRIQMTPYIANTLIHGWAMQKDIEKAREIYDMLGSRAGTARREPSTYEAMTRAYLAVQDRENAKKIVDEMMGRGYPSAVIARVLDLVRMSDQPDA
ncbi:hypothetical protein BZA05DRAFT_86688 [Tricharina praecox]|uniref:uncharacterized protein n=1 Tax=Tricharina praecox TaxID=43433 RepID=UPI0022203759|nr:uncharacterized protein BZA05DRAFT_86688 [Tricharina praecox]KAI5849242.1 hypothetical protein BZA05DRAFT_86688 [Tricharina praecox]